MVVFLKTFTIIDARDDINEWNSLVSGSPQGTIFSLHEYLSSTGLDYKKYFVNKGNDTRAAFCYLVNPENTEIILDELTIYSGIMFSPAHHQKETRRKTEHHEITRIIIEFLTQMYQHIDFQLSPLFEDMRPFLWHNYHSKSANDKFSVTLKYTSFLDIHDLFYRKKLKDCNVYKSLDSKRQSDIIKAQSNALTFIVDSVETDEFINLYKMTLSQQNKTINASYLDRMKTLIDNTCESGLLKKYSVVNNRGITTYIVIFGIFNQTGTYIFGAGDPDVMQRYDATFCIWNALNNLSHQYGVSTIDMEGVNSPDRGRFKLSFGGELKTYFRVSKKREA